MSKAHVLSSICAKSRTVVASARPFIFSQGPTTQQKKNHLKPHTFLAHQKKDTSHTHILGTPDVTYFATPRYCLELSKSEISKLYKPFNLRKAALIFTDRYGDVTRDGF